MRTFGNAVLTFESVAEILWHLYATSDLWFHAAKRNDGLWEREWQKVDLWVLRMTVVAWTCC